MRARPTSVTVIAWILIVMGAISLVVTTIVIGTGMMNDPAARDLVSKNPIPVPVQHAMTYIGALIMLVSSVAMLKGQNWGRWLYVVGTGAESLIAVLTSPLKEPMILGFVVFVVVAFFLFRPKANAYFSDTEPVSPILSLHMIRRVLSIVLYVVAGLFFYMVSLFAFIDGTALGFGVDDAAWHVKWLPIIGFAAPAMLALVVGLAIMGFQNWRRDTGIVFLSAAGFTTFGILSFASLLMNEEFRREMPPEMLRFVGDYITGAAVLVVLAVAGVLLVMTNRRRLQTIA